MEKLNHPAILVVDMLNDVVTGSIGCDRAVEILPATARLLDAARAAGVPVIYCNDSHLPGIDRELQIWGDHAIKGTPGAEVVPELAPQPQDYVVPERRSQGIGRELFAFAEKTLAGEAEQILLGTATKDWRRILHFYIEELGMDFWSARLFKKITG